MIDINVGNLPDDGTGDKLRDAFIHVNDNFDELVSKDKELQENIDKKDDLSTGYIDGLILSINVDNTKFNISPGIYVTNIDGDIIIHNFDQIDGVTPSYLTTSNVTYIGLNENKQIIQSVSPFTNEHRRSICQIGVVIHSNRTNINVVNQIKPTLKYSINQLHDVIKAIGFLNLSGNTYSANGTNLNIDKTSGVVFGLGINSSDNTNPHQITIPEQTNITFRYRLQNGTEYSDTNLIDPTHYDNNGVLTPLLNNNRWSVQHINLFQSGLTRVQYGQHQYNSLDEAESKLKTDTFVTESNISENAIFRSYLIIKKDCTNLSDTTKCKFIPVDKWGNVISGSISLTFQTIIDALGYTPENISNKTNVIGTGTTTNYPSTKAVKQELDLKQDVLTAENVGEFMDLELDTKSTPISGDTLLGRDSITNEAVEIPFSAIQPSLGFTPENISNKTDVIGTGNTTNYPSTKAVVDYVTTTNATWKKSGLSTNANLVNEKIYRQNSVNIIGSTVNFGTGPTQADIDGEVLGSQFGHIFGGGTVPFIQLLGNGANGSAGPNQFISRVVGASTSLQQMTFSTIKSTNYDAWGDAGRLLWRFQDGYLAPQAKFDIGTDYVRLHSYTSSRNDSDVMSNILFTTSNGSLRSKSINNTPFVNKFLQVTGVTITSTGWTLNSGIYEFTYSNVNINSNSIVDVIPDNSSFSIVSSAQLLPRVDSSTGSIKIYSNNLPSGNFDVTIIINKN